MIRLRLLLAIIAGLIAGPVCAQTVDAADRAAVAARIGQLTDAMSAGRLVGTLDVVPPRLLEASAARFGATVEQLRQAFSDNAEQLLAGVTFVSYSMDLEGASVHVTPDGARTYLLIPTKTLMEVAGAGRMRAVSQTLAMEDEGQWYLVRTEDAANRTLLVQVYPEFAGVEFPAGTSGPAD